MASARTRATSASSARAAASSAWRRTSSGRVVVALRLCLLAFALLGLCAHPRELFVQAGIGLGLHAGHFRFERASGGFFGLQTGFDLGPLAEQLDFLLRVFVSAARFGGFLAQPFELGEEAGFRFRAYARDLALERAGGLLIGGVAGFLRGRIACVSSCRACCSSRARSDSSRTPRQLGVQSCLGFLAHALHFFPELVGRGFLGGHARFLRRQLAQRLGFELGLRLRETRFGGFLPKPIELAAKTGFRFFADAV